MQPESVTKLSYLGVSIQFDPGTGFFTAYVKGVVHKRMSLPALRKVIDAALSEAEKFVPVRVWLEEYVGYARPSRVVEDVVVGRVPRSRGRRRGLSGWLCMLKSGATCHPHAAHIDEAAMRKAVKYRVETSRIANQRDKVQRKLDAARRTLAGDPRFTE